jgi:23S rRNA (uracil1939-C5)-methyltransferase
VALEVKTAGHYEMLARRFPQAQLLPPVASPQSFAYRTKVELTFLRQNDGRTTLGFHKRGRFDKGVDVGRCWLTPLPPILLERLRGWMETFGLRGWSPKENAGDLRYLVYRCSSSTGRDLVALVVDSELQMVGDKREALVSLLKASGVSGALLAFQSSVAGAVVPDRCEELFGPQALIDQVGSLTFELGWRSFFQVNPPAYEKLLEAMASWRQAPVGSRLVDLYCGVGSIGLSLCSPGDRLLGVELVEEAVEDARLNALRNGVEAHFESRSAEESLDIDADLLILDPPRSGCHPKLLRLLRESPPAQELFYVSCNPHRLEEELDDIAGGYRLLRAQAFDFFPQTHHAEMLLHFQRISF